MESYIAPGTDIMVLMAHASYTITQTEIQFLHYRTENVKFQYNHQKQDLFRKVQTQVQ